MKHGVVDHPAVSKMLDNDPLQKGRRHSVIPDAFRIHNKDRAARTDAEARCLAAFHPVRPEQQTLALQERRQQTIKVGAPPVGGTESADANEHVPTVGVHRR